MANNFNIGVNFSGNLGNLPGQAAAAAASLNGVGAAAQAAGAGLTGLSGATTAAASSLNRLSPATRPTLTGLTLLGNAGTSAAAGLGATTAAAQSAAAGLSRIRPGANQAGAALSDVGRVAQDLPFGFIGIQNNLNPLLESFQRLRIETGSNRAAFRALGSSLIGAGGIGLALSAVSAAILIFQNGIGGFNRKTKEAADKAKEAADKTKEFVNSLKSVADITGQATGGVQGQITQVQALASVVTNANNSYKDRAAALRELQQINKGYFGDLKVEESQMGILTARVNEYTKAIVQQAVIKGFENEIGKVSTGLYDQEKALKKAELAYKQLSTQVENIQGTKRLRQSYIDLKVATEDARKAFVTQRDAVEKTRGNFVELKGAMSAAVVQGLKFRDLTNSSSGANKNEEDALKKRIASLKELQSLTGLTIPQQIELTQLEIKLASRDAVKNGIKPDELNQQIEGILEKAFPVKTFEFKINSIKVTIPKAQSSGGVSPADIIAPFGITPNAFDGVINSIQESAAIALQRMQERLAESLRNTILNGFVEGLAGVGEAFGNILTGIFSGGIGNALAAAGEGLLNIVGGVLQDIGKQIIATSVLVQTLKKALSSLFANPAAGVAVGIALVGLGQFLKNIKFNTPAFAEGVKGFSGGFALVGERGPELVNLPSGSDVIPNHMLGVGGQSLQVFGVIRGEDIYLSNNRVTQRRRRI